MTFLSWGIDILYRDMFIFLEKYEIDMFHRDSSIFLYRYSYFLMILSHIFFDILMR